MLIPQLAIVPVQGLQPCESAQQPAVGQGLTDGEREGAIQRAGALMEKRYADYAATGCFAALGDAHRAMRLMKELISGRSPEQVLRMERERGLI